MTFYYDNTTHWVTDTINTTMVTAAGSFQSELGCPADWSPDCLRSWLEDPDGDGIFTFTHHRDSCRRLPGEGGGRPVMGYQLRRRRRAERSEHSTSLSQRRRSRTTFSYVASTHVLTVLSGNGLPSLKPQKAYWLSRRLHRLESRRRHRRRSLPSLFRADRWSERPPPTGITGGTAFPLTYDPAGLPADVKAKFPAQAALGALRLAG